MRWQEMILQEYHGPGKNETDAWYGGNDDNGNFYYKKLFYLYQQLQISLLI